METKEKILGGVEIITIEEESGQTEKESKQIADLFEGFEDQISPPFDIEVLADFHVEGNNE